MHVQVYLIKCQERPIEISFHHCGGPVKLVQAYLCAGKT